MISNTEYNTDMKRFIAYAVLVLMSIGCYAQDIIVKKDGSIIQAKIIKIGTAEVDYKKWSNQDGPSYAIAKSDVLAITYQNGEKENFGEEQSAASETQDGNTPALLDIPTASNNQDLLRQYNVPRGLVSSVKKSNSPTAGGIGIFGFTEESVLSNEELEMTFELSKTMYPNSNQRHLFRYAIILHNKSDKTIYVDKANSFRLDAVNHITKSYFNGEQVVVSNGHSTSVGLGIGGLLGGGLLGGGISSSESGSVSRTFTEQRILTIPPHGYQKLTDFNIVKVNTGIGIEVLDRGEELLYGIKINSGEFRDCNIKKGEVTKGDVINYEPENSAIKYQYVITYSTKQDFTTYSNLKAELYLKQLLGYYDTFNLSFAGLWIEGWRAVPYIATKMISGYDNFTICGPIKFEK